MSRALSSLEKALGERLVRATDPTFDAARRVFNVRIDRRPEAVAYCADEAEVALAVRVACDAGLQVTVRSGGAHSPCGYSIADGALVIDVSRIQYARVDSSTGVLHVGGGATWGQVDPVAEAHGVTVPGGAAPIIGVAGLTLSGGLNLSSRMYGLACDSLIGVRIVNANGEVLDVDSSTHADLLWALRGGGMLQLGVVTELRFRPNPLHRGVFGGVLVWPADVGARVTRHAMSYLHDEAPRALHLHFAYGHSEGTPVLVAAGMYNGPEAEGQRSLAPLRALSAPIFDGFRTQAYCDLKASLAADIKPGQKSLWKSAIVEDEPNPDLFEALMQSALAMRSPDSLLALEPLDGAIRDREPSATAFPHRRARFSVLAIAVWDADRSEDESRRQAEWARDAARDFAPHAGKHVYPAYVDSALEHWGTAHFGNNFAKLLAIKHRYDPEHRFRTGYPLPSAVQSSTRPSAW